LAASAVAPRSADFQAAAEGVSMKQIDIWTDGSCSGNPGHGGWAAILRFAARERVISGREPHTTNNRMELTAAICGIEALREPCNVALHTDSAYLINAFEQQWITGWLKRVTGRPSSTP
jgi:ribonuclease HI